MSVPADKKATISSRRTGLINLISNPNFSNLEIVSSHLIIFMVLSLRIAGFTDDDDDDGKVDDDDDGDVDDVEDDNARDGDVEVVLSSASRAISDSSRVLLSQLLFESDELVEIA